MQAESVTNDEVGYFRYYAHPPGGVRREITMFRGSPVGCGGIQTADPFTDVSAELTLPMVTVFDKPGSGDLDWLVPYANIDIVWENTGTYNFHWHWEGFIVSVNFSLSAAESTYTVELKGALFKLDNYLAAPSFQSRPIPYEVLIKKAFDQNEHPAGLQRLHVAFPAGWDTRVPTWDSPSYLGFLRPWGVHSGQKWTGLTARTTGSWSPVLTGYVQPMLMNMFDNGGSQWTIRKDKGRKPVLYLRTIPTADDPDILVIDLLNPGVEIQGSRDFTQSANVIYGQGSDTAGVNYSGMQTTPSGKSTFYQPFAYSAAVYPSNHNPSFNRLVSRKESHIAFQAGMDETTARNVAQSQLHRFSDPGITGSITLSTDVITQGGQFFPRVLIKAGRTISIRGLYGMSTGVLAHITSATTDPTGKSSLTFDTKYRDQLTVGEIQARTRDAMTPLRSLQVGKYSNTIQDLLFPWSDVEGAGIMPNGAKEFFHEKLPDRAMFPYEEWTLKHPPSDPASAGYYVKAGVVDRQDAGQNWAGEIQENEYQSTRSMLLQLFHSARPDDDAPDKEILITYKSKSPSSPLLGDIWIDNSDGNKVYQFPRERKLNRLTGSNNPDDKDENDKDEEIDLSQYWVRFNSEAFEEILNWLPVTLDNTTVTLSYKYEDNAPKEPQLWDIWIKRPSGKIFVREPREPEEE